MTRKGYKKHKKVIKAWVKGGQVQFYQLLTGWKNSDSPEFHENTEYRIKPIEKEEIKLEVGGVYLLKETLKLCHVASPYTGDPRLRGRYTYLGEVITSTGSRNIFYSDKETNYVMFSSKCADYIVRRVK